MSAEASEGHLEQKKNHSEQGATVSNQLNAYIDSLEMRPRERLGYLEQHGMRAVQRFGDIGEPIEQGQLQKEIARLEHMKRDVQQGNFSSITTELDTRRAEPEARLAELHPQLRPPGQMREDEQYFTLKKEIIKGEHIRDKVKGVLDAPEQEWVEASIELFKEKQRQTERGRLMADINREQQTLNEITHLQQLISPSQP